MRQKHQLEHLWLVDGTCKHCGRLEMNAQEPCVTGCWVCDTCGETVAEGDMTYYGQEHHGCGGTCEWSDVCQQCGGTGAVDSGGVTPWGEWIDVPCPECTGAAG